MTAYMKKRKDNKFKKRENQRKITYNKTYKISNAEKIKESLRNAAATY